jgi:hypothetical protein
MLSPVLSYVAIQKCRVDLTRGVTVGPSDTDVISDLLHPENSNLCPKAPGFAIVPFLPET